MARVAQIINATLATDPKQLNSLRDKRKIKANRLPDGKNESPKRLHKRIRMRIGLEMISNAIVKKTVTA